MNNVVSNEKEPTVSIITVCFNAAATIERAMDSVRNQTYPNIEYIVVDGGSDDGTADILKRRLDAIDTFICEPDGGIYDALNKGIRRARGRLIGFVMADDVLLPHAVEEVVKRWSDDTNIDVISGYTEILNRSGMCVGVTIPRYDNKTVHVEIPFPSTFITAEAFKKLGTFNARYQIAGDFEFFLRAHAKGARFGSIHLPLARFSAGGLSTKGSIRARHEAFEIAKNHYGLTRATVGLVQGLFGYGRQKISSMLRHVFGNARVDGMLSWIRKRKKDASRLFV